MNGKIEKSNVEAIFELSSIQQGMFFHYLKEEQGNLYNVQLSLNIEGALDIAALRRAIRLVQAGNEVLRSVFRWEQISKPVQIVLKECEAKVEYKDLSANDSAVIPALVQAYLLADQQQRFDLTALPLRCSVIKISGQSFILNITHHHILYDGWSTGILLKELFYYYHSLAEGKPPVVIGKTAYKTVQQALQKRVPAENWMAYWKSYLDEYEITSLLPADAAGSLVTGQIQQQRFTVPGADLRVFLQKNNVTGAAFMYTACGILLQKYTNASDVVFGTTISDRDYTIQGSDTIMGNFINTIPLRVKGSEGRSLREMVVDMNNDLPERNSYSYVSYANIKELLTLQPAENLFDVVVVIENYPLDEAAVTRAGDLRIQLRSVYEHTGIPLMITVFLKETLEIEFTYARGTADDSYISSLGQHLVTVVQEILQFPDKAFDAICLLSEEEEHQLLHGFNNTAAAYPKDATIISLFEQQVAKTPANNALWYGDTHFSYRELKEESEHMAAWLVQLGVTRGDLVGVMLEREAGLIPAIFGILKAGGAYVPIDPHFPAERINMMMADAHLKVLVTRGKYLQPAITINSRLADLDKREEVMAPELPPIHINGQDLAYVIYTSGSTGKPKGVMVKHHSVINRLLWMQKAYAINETDVLLQKTPVVFDVSVWELFWWSFTGASLCVLSPQEEKDPAAIIRAVKKYGVTTLHFVPSMLNALLHSLTDNDYHSLHTLRQVFSSGEALTREQVNLFGKTLHHHCGTSLINLYGPTEATVDVSFYECGFAEPAGVVPIGKPIDNIRLYILDKWKQLAPIGVAGELYISGAGVAEGYLLNKSLTDEKFIADPFHKGERMYKTGDLVKWLPDGNIGFSGRIDHQVKIRGLRIELGEIENQLQSHEKIKDAVVVAREQEGDKYLVAYYVAEQEISTAALTAFLAAKLPAYMVPQYYVYLQHLPLTTSGKVNRKALPVMEVFTREEEAPPADEIEEQLLEILSDILKREKEYISRRKSFFEQGGHSLKAIGLINRIWKAFNIAMPLNEVFNYPDISGIAGFIRAAKKAAYTPVEKAATRACYPLSSAQQRLYFLYELDRSSTAYNMSHVSILEGVLDKDRLEHTFRMLIERHEILHTAFVLEQESPAQKILDDFEFNIASYAANGNVQEIIKDFIRPFDLTRPPLIRVGLISTDTPHTHILMVDMHHIVCDGVSLDILIKDFQQLWQEGALLDPVLQYKDYAIWERDAGQQHRIAGQKDYWCKEFAAAAPVLELPADYTRPMTKSDEGSSLSFTLDLAETTQLKTIGQQEGSTTFMVLLAVYNILLSKLSNQTDIVVGVPAAGRQHPDLEHMMGMFVNTLPLRNYPKEDLRFSEFLAAVRSRTLACFNQQDYPYELLIDDLHLPRDAGRNPLFDLMFVYQHAGVAELQLPGLVVKPFATTTTRAKFDLTLSAFENEEGIRLELEYATRLFKQETVARFIVYFHKIIDRIIQDQQVLLSDISILTEEEEQRILHEFNDTAIALPQDQTVIGLFEAQVSATPDHIAVKSDDEQLSYREFNQQKDQLAALLIRSGVLAGELVGVMLDREIRLVPSVYGIMKAGAVYVPIDPLYPADRIHTIIGDAGIKTIITCSKYRSSIAAESLRVIDLDTDWEAITTQEAVALKTATDSKAPAYVIYTSGSTGKPKGVVIRHHSLVNLLHHMQVAHPLLAEDRYLLKTTYSFDVSMTELFGWFHAGGSLSVLAAGGETDLEKLLTTIEKDRITHINFVPSMFSVFVEHIAEHGLARLRSLKYIFVAGEALPNDLVSRFHGLQSGIVLSNYYGPTEATVYGCGYETVAVSGYDRVPIGKPISNVTAYVVGANGQLQPIGVAGELYLGGAGIASGYLGDEALTRERFIADHFTGEGHLYKTGDLARWLPDGQLDFIGRRDEQVKIRGFRIELSEITHHLKRYGQITDAVVIARKGEGEQYLAGYYVSAQPLSTMQLREYLLSLLPDYMVPFYYVHLAALPLTGSGKIDRKALPAPELGAGVLYEAPQNREEAILAGVWEAVLKMERIGIYDNFFSVGGDSIKSIQISARMRSLGYEISVKEIFRNQTIHELSRHLKMLHQPEDKPDVNRQNGAAVQHPIPEDQLNLLYQQYQVQDIYPLSPTQEGMLFHSLMDGESNSYLGQTTFKVNGALNIYAVEQSMNDLLARYDILRTIFLYEGYERPLQLVLKERTIDFWYQDISELTDAGSIAEVIEVYRSRAKSTKFNLNRDVLMRLCILKTGDAAYEFIWTHHHILMDGWCMGIIVQDFTALYAHHATGQPLSLPAVTPYSRYISWMEGRDKTSAANYWRDYLASYENKAILPQKEVSAHDSLPYLLKRREIVLDKATTGLLQNASRAYRVTLNTLFQAAWGLLLSRYNNTSDVVFGAVVSGRPAEIAGIETMIGLFINTIPIRIRYHETTTVPELLQDIQDKAVAGLPYYHHALTDIQSLSELGRELLHHIMVFENLPVAATTAGQEPGGFAISDASYIVQTNYDFRIGIVPSAEYIIQLDYNASLYDDRLVSDLGSQLKNILCLLAEQPGGYVKDISLYSPSQLAEMQQQWSTDLEEGIAVVTIQELLSRSFRKYADKCALEYKGANFTYTDMAITAGKIAALLIRQQLPEGSSIGIFCEDRRWLICAILGILQARMVFVPLDITLPGSRLAAMIDQVHPRCIITDQEAAAYGQLLPGDSVTWINTTTVDQQEEVPAATMPFYDLTDLIYIYFTSGSTGIPKGVVGRNKGLSQFIAWEIACFGLDASFRCSQFINPGFDAFMRDILVPLCCGGTICVPDADVLSTGWGISRWIDSQKIHLVHTVPSLFRLWSKDDLEETLFHALKYVLLAGEKILPYELTGWYQVFGDRIQLVNLYGPTETTLLKAYRLIRPEDSTKNVLPVRPMPGAQLLLLDQYLHICPRQSTGEIYIRTPYRTAGYFGQEAANRQAFIVNPFNRDPEDLLYKTGDMGSMQDDGTMTILGRQDHQVKLRGIRIELDDIKENLLRYPGITDAVVMAKEDKSSAMFICAYVVAADLPDPQEVRTYLSQVLPAYMIPAYIISLATLPLTPNGKLDRNALPDPVMMMATTAYVPPSGKTETDLVNIWADVLKTDPGMISITSSFFEVGGDSIKVMLLVNKINRQYNVSIPFKEFFSKMNIQNLAAYLGAIQTLKLTSADNNNNIEIKI
jgi:amino acid adenylation domain-containing protein